MQNMAAVLYNIGLHTALHAYKDTLDSSQDIGVLVLLFPLGIGIQNTPGPSAKQVSQSK